MLPLQQAQELKSAISEYLKATFTFRETEVNNAFHQFINDPKDGLFRGPYVSVELPFKKLEEGANLPLELQPGFNPFVHQAEAFNRLSSENGSPEPTLLTTGTGSGKTESFLYPILDYCYKNRDRKGIKAIILYPMNALATDQAQRLAEIIWSDDRLKDNITAGLFIGEGNTEKEYHSDMGKNHIIEKRNSIIDTRPDILLTNFKMLDYGLMRNRYHNLWSHNFNDSSLLKFLVLDELHTYDGAQGTDVANLIRRLKLKLNIDRGELCPVGTSATIGEGEESIDLLTNYAGKVFGESFESESVITEERLSWDQFLTDAQSLKEFIPRLQAVQESRIQEDDDYDSYITKQKKLWRINTDSTPYETGEDLKKLKIFKDLLQVATSEICSETELVKRIADKNKRFSELPEWDSRHNISPRKKILESLLALVAYAKSDESAKWPFLLLRVQIWIRELSGIMRFVDEPPEFTWRDSNDPEEQDRATLPMYFCRECGASGWLTKKRDDHNKLSTDTSEIFPDYFSNHKNIYFVNTDRKDHQPIEEYGATTTHKNSVSKEDLQFANSEGEDTLDIIALRKLNSNNKSEHVCPECGTANSVSIVGTRMATLSSVAVSQTLSSNLEEREDGYRKLLAFTNSVQDAAHNAGFIEARNYRFMFRTSLQKVLNQVYEEVSLVELIERFKKFWKEQSEDNQSYFYRFYPEDCERKAPIESYKHQHGDSFTDRFKEEFDLRMSWEVMAEYGYNALLGRTLEKTGSSTVWVPEENVSDLYGKLKPWMDNNLMENVSEEDLLLFLSGVIYRFRVRGGIDHPFFDKFRKDEASSWNLNWMRDSRHFLNRNFHLKKSRFPKLLTTKSQRDGILDTTHTNQQNWYHQFFKKSFSLVPDNRAMINDFYEVLFENLTEVGIVNEEYAKNEKSYALNPEIFRVSKQLKVRECDECGHRISTAELDPYLGYSKCQQYRCTGTYSIEVEQEYDYYNKVFNRAYSPRVISSEHTGILDRDDRENIEESFKNNLADRSINTLVATSTLEMGIDIGQLDSSFNLGLPPFPSNYMQRIGRAGRSTGNSLISNFVSRRNPHDLFFFEEPKEMMDGEIHTPGCFLNAPEILKRQFLAHCIDRWIAEDFKKNFIPNRVQNLKLSTTDLRDSGFFLNRLFSYIKDNKESILESLNAVYKPELEDKQLINLREEIERGNFGNWILSPFFSLKNRILEIQRQREEIDDYINEKNLSKNDEERKKLEKNKTSLYKSRKKLEDQDVIEFMTLSGILPNYAFPDKGVEFSGRIFQPSAKGSDSKPQNISREYIRPSSQAIRELAPHNNFFAEGYKFDIQGLMTHEWGGQNSPLEEFRFCSECDYIEQEQVESSKKCPKCGDESFGAASNVHHFAEMTGAKSEVNRYEAALDDSSDERDTVFYDISRHASFIEHSANSLALVDIPFGIEFAPSVELTDVNLGKSETVSANRIHINQHEEVPRHGFVTCKHCGYSTNTPALEGDPKNKDKYKFHYPYCKHRGKHFSGEANEIFEEVFLYRKQKTEALKILLPVQTFATDEFRHIFRAGIELGLREYYKGNPAHLAFTNYREFNRATSKFDQYLLLYDKVPGGTGYLSKLYDKENFTEILEKAYYKIKTCSCQHEGKDGCYHCVYSYRNQYISSVLSRSRAEKIFEDLLKHASNWKSLDHSLSDVTKNGQIEESELEERFILALEKWCDSSANWVLEKETVNNTQHYYITVPHNSENEITYMIQPQIWLGTADGVSKSTRPDFIMKAVESGGTNEDAFREYKDIAIYLDGYQYHASVEHNRFHSDIEKRKAVLESERYKVWVLTWDDVDGFLKALEDDNFSFKDDMSPAQNKYVQSTQKIKQTPIWNFHDSTADFFNNSLSRLLGMLTIKEDQKEKSIAVAGMRSMEKFPIPNIPKSDLQAYLSMDLNSDSESTVPNGELGESFLISDWENGNGLFASRILMQLASATAHSRLWFKQDNFAQIDRDEWNQFWRSWNLLQYGSLQVEDIANAVSEPESGGPEELEELLIIFDEEMHQLIKRLVENEIPFNQDGGFFIELDDGFAEAQLGFEDPKVVFIPIDEKSAKEFKKRGFEIANPKEFDINRLKS